MDQINVQFQDNVLTLSRGAAEKVTETTEDGKKGDETAAATSSSGRAARSAARSSSRSPVDAANVKAALKTRRPDGHDPEGGGGPGAEDQDHRILIHNAASAAQLRAQCGDHARFGRARVSAPLDADSARRTNLRAR